MIVRVAARRRQHVETIKLTPKGSTVQLGARASDLLPPGWESDPLLAEPPRPVVSTPCPPPPTPLSDNGPEPAIEDRIRSRNDLRGRIMGAGGRFLVADGRIVADRGKPVRGWGYSHRLACIVCNKFTRCRDPQGRARCIDCPPPKAR